MQIISLLFINMQISGREAGTAPIIIHPSKVADIGLDVVFIYRAYRGLIADITAWRQSSQQTESQ